MVLLLLLHALVILILVVVLRLDVLVLRLGHQRLFGKVFLIRRLIDSLLGHNGGSRLVVLVMGVLVIVLEVLIVVLVFLCVVHIFVGLQVVVLLSVVPVGNVVLSVWGEVESVDILAEVIEASLSLLVEHVVSHLVEEVADFLVFGHGDFETGKISPFLFVDFQHFLDRTVEEGIIVIVLLHQIKVILQLSLVDLHRSVDVLDTHFQSCLQNAQS